jgi:hypothetical protein
MGGGCPAKSRGSKDLRKPAPDNPEAGFFMEFFERFGEKEALHKGV